MRRLIEAIARWFRRRPEEPHPGDPKDEFDRFFGS